jgi:hypothetical protein
LPPSLASAITSWCQAQYAAENEPVPYSLTPKGEAALVPYPGRDDPERLAQWCGFASAADMTAAYEKYARAAEAEEEAEREAAYEAEWADNWDSADSSAYMDRVEAGLEPEAEL